MSSGNNSFAALRRFVRKRAPVEVCEMCSRVLDYEHQHLIEPSTRKLTCACDPCALLFSSDGETRFKRVPRRIRFLSGFRMTDAQWGGLLISINMAFFFFSTPEEKVIALYPSPAGATESLLELGAWEEIVEENLILKQMEADIEALLVDRVSRGEGGREGEYYLVPIDVCYKLVGLIRAHWRGLSGGGAVWEEMAEFFADLKRRSVSTN